MIDVKIYESNVNSIQNNVIDKGIVGVNKQLA